MGPLLRFFAQGPEDLPFCRPEWKQSEKNWVIHIKRSLKETKCTEHTHPPSIFLTSSPLRSLKHEDFVPQVVAIGPYHADLGPQHSSFPENRETKRYKAIAAQEMVKHKVFASKYVEQTLKNRDIGILVREFLLLIPHVRDEYDTELVSFQVDEKLAYMLALDGGFIIEVLRSEAGVKGGFHEYYCSWFPRPLRKSILLDFLLLENQIPLFLLLKIMQLDEGCTSNEHAEGALVLLVKKVAQEILPFSSLSDESLRSGVGRRKHLLDCLYVIVTHGGMSELPAAGSASPLTDQFVEKPTHFPCAVDLISCGIKIRAVEPGNTTSVKYDAKRAILYVPKVHVKDDTERLLRNLVAYESHLTDEVHVLSYLCFMSGLIEGPDDVEKLVAAGVVLQDIGSNKEVALVWNRLCIKTMRICSTEMEGIAQQLLRHCRHRPNVLRAEFKRTYLSRPWLTISLGSFACLLIMNFLSVIYAILLYTEKWKNAAKA